MADLTLHASLPLNALDVRIADTRLSAIENLDIVSIALPMPAKTTMHDNSPDSSHQALEQRLQDAYGLTLPDTGYLTENDHGYVLLGLQPDLWFMTSENQTRAPARTLKTVLGDTAYLTDQSDSWAIVELHGPKALTALERCCPLDMNEASFDHRCVARTVMEHLSVIIHRPDSNRFRLMSPRSSAQSFSHMLSTSLQNVY